MNTTKRIADVKTEAVTKKLDFKVVRMYKFTGTSAGPLKAFVDVSINDAIIIKGFRVLEGKKGLFVSLPYEMAKDSKWFFSVTLLTKTTRDSLSKAIFKAYDDMQPETFVSGSEGTK